MRIIMHLKYIFILLTIISLNLVNAIHADAVNNTGDPILLSAYKPTGTWTSKISNSLSHVYLVDEPNKVGVHLFCTVLKKARQDNQRDIYIDLLQFAYLSYVRFYFDVNCCKEPFSQFDVKIGIYPTSSESYTKCGSGTQNKSKVDVDCSGRARVVQAIFADSSPIVKICELEVYGFAGDLVDIDHTFRIFQTEDLIGCKEMYNRTVETMILFKGDTVAFHCTNCSQVSVGFNPGSIAPKTLYLCQTLYKGSRNTAGPSEIQSKPILLSANKPTGTWTGTYKSFSDSHQIVDEPNKVDEHHKSCSWLYTFKNGKGDVYVDLLQYAELSRVRLYFGASCCEALKLIVKIGIHLTPQNGYSQICGSGTYNENKVAVNCTGHARVVQVIFIDIGSKIEICELEVYGFAGPSVDRNHTYRIYPTTDSIECKEMHDRKVERMTLYNDDDIAEQCTNCSQINHKYDNNETSFYRCETLHKGSVGLIGPILIRNGRPTLLTKRNNPTGTWTSRTDCYNDIHLILDEQDKLNEHTSCTRLLKKGDDQRDLYVDLIQYAFLTSVRLYFGVGSYSSRFRFFVKIGKHLTSSESYTDCGSALHNRYPVNVNCNGHARVIQVIFFDIAPQLQICELQVFGFVETPADIDQRFRTFVTEDIFGCMEINYKFVDTMTLYKDGNIVKQCNDCYIVSDNRAPEKLISSSTYFHCTTISTDGSSFAGPTKIPTKSTEAVNNKDSPILLSTNKPTGTWTSRLNTYSQFSNRISNIVDEPNVKYGQYTHGLLIERAKKDIEYRDVYVDLLEYAELSRVRFHFSKPWDCKFVIKIGMHLTSNKGYKDCGYGISDKFMVDVDCIEVGRVVQVVFIDHLAYTIGINEMEVYGFAGPPADTNHTFEVFQTNDTIGCKEMGNQTVENMTLYKDDSVIVKQCTNCSQVSEKYNPQTIVPKTYYRCETLHKSCRGAAGPIELGKP